MWTCPNCGANLLNSTLECPICVGANSNTAIRDEPVRTPFCQDKILDTDPFTGFERLMIIGVLGTMGAAIAPIISAVLKFGADDISSNLQVVGVFLFFYWIGALPLIAIGNLVLSFCGFIKTRTSALLYDLALIVFVVAGWLIFL
jgi:hypothetical protein